MLDANNILKSLFDKHVVGLERDHHAARSKMEDVLKHDVTEEETAHRFGRAE